VPIAILAAALFIACNGQLSASTEAPLASRASGPLARASHVIGVPPTMLPVVANSRSLILRATHILFVRVNAVEATAWTPRAGGGEERKLALTLRLDGVPKGQVDQREGAEVHVEALQRRLGFGWGPMPGVWSNVTVESGMQLVAFAVATSSNAAVLLTDPAAVEVLTTEEAQADVTLAARTSSQPLSAVLAAARPQAPTLRHLFADYLWASYRAAAMKDFSTFEAIVTAMEWPDLNTVARATLLMSIPDDVLAVEPVATQYIDRLAASMVRILLLPQAKELRENILGTFLPNLVDADDPASRPPARVFAAYPAERESLRKLAAAPGQDAQAAALFAWARR
jgi:hypothetical protein